MSELKCTACRKYLPVESFHRDKSRARGYDYRCRACKKYKNNLWYDNNREVILEDQRDYYQANKEAILKRQRTNRSPRLLSTSKKVRVATPPWLTDGQKQSVMDIYYTAKMLTKVLGTVYHVDHIVPLKGKNVCGLHVPWNLRVIPASENLSKGNSYG